MALLGSRGYDILAGFAINRDLEANPLHESYGGTGQLMLVRLSAAQLLDKPVILNGS